MGMTACDDNDDNDKGKNTGKNAVTCRPRCDVGVLVTCGDDGKEKRTNCPYGCDGTFNRCLAESQEPCDHEGVACDGDELVTCINGVVASRQSCGVLGCDASTNKCVRRVCFDDWSKCTDDGKGLLLCANNSWYDGGGCKNGCFDGKCVPDEKICIENQKKCDGNAVAVCTNNEWVAAQTCEYGCDKARCLNLQEALNGPCDNSFSEACDGDVVYYCGGGVVTDLDCSTDNMTCGIVEGIADCFGDVCQNEGDNTIRCVESGGSNFAVMFTCLGLDDGTNRYYHNGFEIYAPCSGACTDGIGCDGMVTTGGKDGDPCLAPMYTESCPGPKEVLYCDADYGEVVEGACSGDRQCAIDPATNMAACSATCDTPSKGVTCYWSDDSVYAVQSECKAGTDGNLYNFLDFDHYEPCEYSCSEKGDKPGCGGKLVEDQGATCDVEAYEAKCSADGDVAVSCNYDYWTDESTVVAFSCASKYGADYSCGIIRGKADCHKPCDASEVGTKRVEACLSDYDAEIFEVCTAADDGSGYYWVSVSEARYCLSTCNADGTACIPDSEAKISVCSDPMLTKCQDGSYEFDACVEQYAALFAAFFGMDLEEAKAMIIEEGYCDDAVGEGTDTCVAIDGTNKACADYCDAVGPITKCEWDDDYSVYTTWIKECVDMGDGKNAVISRGYEDCAGGCSEDGTRCLTDEELKTWCDSKTYEESCDGDVVRYCSGNTIKEIDCKAQNAVCVLDDGYADCYPDIACEVGDTTLLCSTDSDSGASYALLYTCAEFSDGSKHYTPDNGTGYVTYARCNGACTDGTGCEGMVSTGGNVGDLCMAELYEESCNDDGISGLYCKEDIDWSTWDYVYSVEKFTCSGDKKCAVDPDDGVADCHDSCKEGDGDANLCYTSTSSYGTSYYSIKSVCKKAVDDNYYRFFSIESEDDYELCEYGCADGKCMKLEDTVSTACSTSSYPGYCGDDNDTIYFCNSGVVLSSKCTVAYGEKYSCLANSNGSSCVEKCTAEEEGTRRGENCSSARYSAYEECKKQGNDYIWTAASTRCDDSCDSNTGRCTLSNAESVGTVCDASTYKSTCGSTKNGDADVYYFCGKVASSAPNATVFAIDCKKAHGENYTCKDLADGPDCVETCDPATYVDVTTCSGYKYNTKTCGADGIVTSVAGSCMDYCNSDKTGCNEYGTVADVCADGQNKCSADGSGIQKCAASFPMYSACGTGKICDDSTGVPECIVEEVPCDPATYVNVASCTGSYKYHSENCSSDGKLTVVDDYCINLCADDKSCDEHGLVHDVCPDEYSDDACTPDGKGYYDCYYLETIFCDEGEKCSISSWGIGSCVAE